MTQRPSIFELSLNTLQIGVYKNLSSCLETTPFYQLLEIFEKMHFAAIPIVDEKGFLIHTLYKSELAVC